MDLCHVWIYAQDDAGRAWLGSTRSARLPSVINLVCSSTDVVVLY